jgi:hypothetical protein
MRRSFREAKVAFTGRSIILLFRQNFVYSRKEGDMAKPIGLVAMASLASDVKLNF